MENNLQDLRSRIDNVDNEIIRLFQERMNISSSIAEYKKANNLPVQDIKRERDKLSDLINKSDEDFKSYTSVLYSLLFELSRSYQDRILYPTSDLKNKVSYAIDNTNKLFPPCATVACQGVEGAYSQHACEKLFQIPKIMYFNNFASIFASIDKGLCDYGVLPIENSTAGSVKQIYDLMMYYNFNIVRSVRVKVDHNLLAKKGTDISKIREIYSHEHALAQCTHYINSLGNVKVTVVENTAVAAKMVAESDRDDIAAISSRSCAPLYGLDCLASSIQDKGNNYTRFICISKNLEIYPGADRTSLMMIISHNTSQVFYYFYLVSPIKNNAMVPGPE
ncbi:MAG: chorismate mutase [Clostridia bacterium]|nr:chorismate mutase [Clostridia bacterium]